MGLGMGMGEGEDLQETKIVNRVDVEVLTH